MIFRHIKHPLIPMALDEVLLAFGPFLLHAQIPLQHSFLKIFSCFRRGSLIFSGKSKCQSKDLCSPQYALLMWLLVSSLKVKGNEKIRKVQEKILRSVV